MQLCMQTKVDHQKHGRRLLLGFHPSGHKTYLTLAVPKRPKAKWTVQQGRNFLMHTDDIGVKCEHLCRDNDTKYVADFDALFESTGCTIKRTAYRSPNLQAHIERVIQTIKHKVVNAFCIVSDANLNHILRTTMRWYNERRGHSARDNLPPVRDCEQPIVSSMPPSRVVCDTELGGHLKSYRRVA